MCPFGKRMCFVHCRCKFVSKPLLLYKIESFRNVNFTKNKFRQTLFFLQQYMDIKHPSFSIN